jgi:hypothetical protein
MTQNTLLEIRNWYQDLLVELLDAENRSENQQCRLYVRQRIQNINLMLLKQDEQDYLKTLDALFLIDGQHGRTTTANLVCDICERSAGVKKEEDRERETC